MPPPRPTQLKLRRDAGGRIQAVAAPDRAPVIARAGTALAQLTRMAEQAGANAIEVQPIIQLTDARGYSRFRANREAAWRAEGGKYGTGSWPAALAPKGLAAVILPLPVGVTKGPVVADPMFTSESGADGAGPEDVAFRLTAEWLRFVSSGPALRLAPPVLETPTGRQVVDLGLRWPLSGDASPSA